MRANSENIPEEEDSFAARSLADLGLDKSQNEDLTNRD